MSYIICFLSSQVINQKELQTVRVHYFEGKNVSCNICFRSSGRSGPWILDVTWHKMLTVKFVCRNTFLVSHFLTIKTHTNEYLLKMNVLSDGSSLLSLCLQFSFSVMHSDILHIHVQHNQQQSLLKPEMYRIISLALHEYTLDILNLQISFSPWLLLRLPFFILALFENNSAFNILFVFGLLPCIGVISHPLFLSLSVREKCCTVLSWQPGTASVRLFALSTRPVRGCHRSMSPLRRQTARLSQSLTGPAVFFSLFLPSYLLRHTLCLPPCDLSCERGSDRPPGDAALDTNVDIRTRWHRWETVLYVCVCWPKRPAHKHHPVDCGNAEDTHALLFLCFCWWTRK